MRSGETLIGEDALLSNNNHPFCSVGRACAGFASACTDVQELLRGQDHYISGRLFGWRWYRSHRACDRRHIERYIPGKPRIDVANKPGAGGMIAANELYNLKKPDGLSISTLNTGSLFATATGNEAIKFDLQKFIWLGQAFDDAQVLYLKTSTPYTSFDAVRKANAAGKQPKMGAQALDHTSNVVVKIAEQILGWTSKSSPDIRVRRRSSSISSAALSMVARRALGL